MNLDNLYQNHKTKTFISPAFLFPLIPTANEPDTKSYFNLEVPNMPNTNFIKNIADKKITEEVHNAFTRYSLGEFTKEPFVIKQKKGEIKVSAGFEYLNFFHKFLSENLKGEIELDGTIESVHDLSPVFAKYKIESEDKHRFGKSGSKYTFTAKVSSDTYKKLVEELFGEYLLFHVNSSGGKLKVKKQSTPKLGSPTDNFVTLILTDAFVPAFKEDYLFDADAKKFNEIIINNIYFIDNIQLDEKLLQSDATAARKKAQREGEIQRKITVDGKVVKDYKITFKV